MQARRIQLRSPGLRLILANKVATWFSGVHVPYRYGLSLPNQVACYREVENAFEYSANSFTPFLTEIANHAVRFATFGQKETDPIWTSRMFPALDGAAAYTVVRHYRPKRIIEIGSGDSTRFLVTAARDGSACEVTCIDPAPRRSIQELDVSFEQRVLDQNDAQLAAALEADDILFIDSSHQLLPGNDVDIQLNRMFPRLKSGVLVHLHDIFLPDGYPAHWLLRRYSEQNALIGWIVSGFFEIIYPGHYIVTRMGNAVDELVGKCPQLDQGKVSGSLWLRRR